MGRTPVRLMREGVPVLTHKAWYQRPLSGRVKAIAGVMTAVATISAQVFSAGKYIKHEVQTVVWQPLIDHELEPIYKRFQTSDAIEAGHYRELLKQIADLKAQGATKSAKRKTTTGAK